MGTETRSTHSKSADKGLDTSYYIRPSKGTRPPARLPLSATPFRIDDPKLPDLYLIGQHSKVLQPHGTIMLAVYDWSQDAMKCLFKHGGTMQPAKSLTEAMEKGIGILSAANNDYFVLRDKYGSGNEIDDKVGSWSHTRERLAKQRVEELVDIRDRIIGPQELVGPNKAYRDAHRNFVDGVEFERSVHARPIGTSPRCYSVSLITQNERRMTAPTAGSKMHSVNPDSHSQLRSDILKYGSLAVMDGMHKGPPGLIEMLENQAEFVNLPRIGSDCNVAHPAYQLNITTAEEPTPEEAEPEDDDPNNIQSLGKFGGAHIDGSDSPAAPTGMTVLSHDYDGVEKDLFYILDFGVAWLLEPISIFYFSGLHFHGGSQPIYKSNRVDTSFIYYRLTLIAYPPDDVLAGKDALAFATLPTNKLLTLGFDFRDATHLMPDYVNTGQATYTSDGGILSEPISYFRHWSRAALEFMVGLVGQMDPRLLPRIDTEKFLSAFSCVVDGERIQAPNWDLAPCWKGDDVQIGRQYTNLLQSNFRVSSLSELAKKDPESLARLWNSDNLETTFPFDKPKLMEARDRWVEHTNEQMRSIPSCASLEEEIRRRGRLMSFRKGGVKAARNPNSAFNRNLEPASKGTRQEVGGDEDQSRQKPKKSKRTREEGDDDQSRPKPKKSKRTREEVDGDEVQTRPKAKKSKRTRDDGDEDEVQSRPKPKKLKRTREEGDGDEDQSRRKSPRHAKSVKPIKQTKQLPTGGQEISKCFLQELTLPHLCFLEADARNMGAIVVGALSPNNLLAAFHELHKLDFSGDVIEKAKSFSIKLNSANQEVFRSRASHLLLTFLLWDWLERQVMESLDDSPIGRLRGAIAALWKQRPVTQLLDASDYLKGVAKGKVTYSLKIPTYANRIASTFEFHELAITVLARWFGFPDLAKSRPKAWFVRVVLHSPLGLDGFYLNPFVAAASNVATNVLGVGRNCSIRQADLNEWAQNSLQKHIICDPASEHSGLASRIATLLKGALPFCPSIVEQVEKAKDPFDIPAKYRLISSPNPLMCSAVSNESLWMPKREAFLQLCALIKGLFPFLDPVFTRPSESEMQLMDDDTEEERRSAHYKIFLHHVYTNSDKLLPFRNLATSRKRILQPGGPYSPEHVATKEGLFSAIIYRGITHNSDFLLENKTLFTSFDDWTTFYKYYVGQKKDKSYFCRANAYGSPAKAREVENIEGYWMWVQDEKNTNWLTAADKIDPFDLFCLFLKLYGFGPLTAFQLSMDYVECGMTQPLTVEHMARFICTVGLGGLKGLETLGYKPVKATKKNHTAVAQALDILQRELIKELPEAQRHAMGFGLIFIEHALCKLNRLTKEQFWNWQGQ